MDNSSASSPRPDTPSWFLYWSICCIVLLLGGILGGPWLGLKIWGKTGLLRRSSHKLLLLWTFGFLPVLSSAMLAPFLADIIVQTDIVLFGKLTWKSPFITCDASKQGGVGGADHLLRLKESLIPVWQQEGCVTFLSRAMEHDSIKVVVLLLAIAVLLLVSVVIGDHRIRRVDTTAANAGPDEKAEKCCACDARNRGQLPADSCPR